MNNRRLIALVFENDEDTNSHIVCQNVPVHTETKQAVGGRPPRYASAPCKLTIYSYLFARWHLFRHVGYLRHRQQVDIWPFDLESGVRVTCDVGYLCANLVFLGLSVL